MNLKYRIHSISSEDPQHPARDLLLADHSDENQDTSNLDSKFWESEINPKYPQELTIQFYIPVRTKNLQLTLHPYKIPSKLEIFVKATKKQKYQKLGFVVPSDNVQSNFLEKEKKTLFFEYPCTFIKIIFHQNYRNNRNLFDQVGVWDLKVEGECLPASEMANLDYDFLEALETDEDYQSRTGDPSNSRQRDSEVSIKKHNPSNSQSSTLFPQIFKILETAKVDAVENQDFEKASQIKKTIINFKDIERQIQQLEQQKRKALDDEDYDRCHRLKNEILKKKDQANFQIKQIQQHFLQNISEAHSKLIPHQYHPLVNHQQKDYHTNRSRAEEQQVPSSPFPNRSRYRNPESNRISNSNQIEDDNHYDKYESQVVPALKKKIQEQFNSVSRVNQSISESVEHNLSYNNANFSKRNNTDESRVNYNIKELPEYAEESIDMCNYDIEQILNEHPKLEPMDLKDIKKYQRYFEYIPQELWRMSLSQKYWKLKGYAMDKVITYQIQCGFHIQAIMELVAIIIEDNHPINVKKCLLILEKIISIEDKDYFDFQPASSPRYYIETILGNLLHLLTDTKEQFRKLSAEIYKNLPDFSIVPLEQSIKLIVKNNYSIHNASNVINVSKQKRKFTPKQLLAKIGLIEYLANTYHDAQAYFSDIIKWGVSLLEDPDSNVKSAATKLLLQISIREKHYFSKIKDEILKKKSRKQIYQNFESYYESLLEEIQQQEKNNQSEYRQSSIQSNHEQSLYNKETMMRKNASALKRKNNSDDPEAHLQKMQESPIQSPSKLKESADIELAYSQESLFQEQSHQSHEWFANKNQPGDKYGDLHVMEPFDNELEGLCDYCFQKIGQGIELQQHLLQYCTALLACPFCYNQIYFRQLNQHWVSQCPKKCHQQCPRCLVAFEIDQINEHIARKICRKVNPESGIEICPLCYSDIEGDDLPWVEHSEVCPGVKQIRQRSKGRSKINDSSSIQSF